MKRPFNFYFRTAAVLSIAAVLLTENLPLATAAGSWAPTLLVNTESFQSIEGGDGSTNIELQFGRSTLKGKLFYDITNNIFKFDRGLTVGGTITATGSAIIKGNISGATLRIDGAANINGALTTSGALRAIGATTLQGATSVTNTLTVTGNTKVRANLSGSTLNVDGNAQINGALSATGAIQSKTDITINADNGATDATLNFGNATTVGTLKYLNSSQMFEFNKGISVKGTVSGSSLQVTGGAVRINGVQYNYTGSQGGANTFLKNDGAGNLTWESSAVGNSSGSIVKVQAAYPNAVYFASGATTIGQLSTDYDTTNKENFYHWVSTRSGIQDYWVGVKVRVPKNFNNWGSNSGIVLKLRTTSTSAAVNYVTVKLQDTTGTDVAITGGGAQASTTGSVWRNIALGNITSGTYTPGGDITVLVKVASTSAGSADVAGLTFNWSTTTP